MENLEPYLGNRASAQASAQASDQASGKASDPAWEGAVGPTGPNQEAAGLVTVNH